MSSSDRPIASARRQPVNHRAAGITEPEQLGRLVESFTDGIVQPIREEFVSGTRLGVHEAFKLSYEAIGPASVPFLIRKPDAPRL